MNIYQHRNYITASQTTCSFISIMCTYNVQPIITLLLLCFFYEFTWIYIKKELTVQVPSKKSCVRYSRLSGTNWAYVDHVQTQATFPPLLIPYLSPVPDQGHQENWGGEGEESLLVISCLLCADRILSRLWSIIYARGPLSYLMGHPSMERTPMCCIWNTSSLRKNSQGRYTWILPTFRFWIAAIISTLVIRSSLKDWQSMKKECIHARHTVNFRNMFYVIRKIESTLKGEGWDGSWIYVLELIFFGAWALGIPMPEFYLTPPHSKLL